MAGGRTAGGSPMEGLSRTGWVTVVSGSDNNISVVKGSYHGMDIFFSYINFQNLGKLLANTKKYLGLKKYPPRDTKALRRRPHPDWNKK
jgi:hypothetical protein